MLASPALTQTITRRSLRILIEHHLKDSGETQTALAEKLGISGPRLSQTLASMSGRDRSWCQVAQHFGFEPTLDPHIFRRAA